MNTKEEIAGWVEFLDEQKKIFDANNYSESSECCVQISKFLKERQGGWVKASVQLPENSNKKAYFCNFYMLGQLVKKDIATGKFIHAVKDFLRPIEPEEAKFFTFNEIEWYDESNNREQLLFDALKEIHRLIEHYHPNNELLSGEISGITQIVYPIINGEGK